MKEIMEFLFYLLLIFFPFVIGLAFAKRLVKAGHSRKVARWVFGSIAGIGVGLTAHALFYISTGESGILIPLFIATVVCLVIRFRSKGATTGYGFTTVPYDLLDYNFKKGIAELRKEAKEMAQDGRRNALILILSLTILPFLIMMLVLFFM